MLPPLRYAAHFRYALCVGRRFPPTLSKILGHADLSMLNKYVHPSQGDMDRAMEWYTRVQATHRRGLQDMLLEAVGSENSDQKWPGPVSGPLTGQEVAQIGPSRSKVQAWDAQAREKWNYDLWSTYLLKIWYAR